MGVSFLKGIPALMIEKERLIAVGDLHIGMEEKFSNSGIEFPNAARATGREIRGICESNSANGVVFLGDVKDSIANMTKEGMDSIRTFFRELDGINVIIAKGNHDAHIESLIGEMGFKAEIKKEILLSECALMHGNAMPSDDAVLRKYIICGHAHMAAHVNGIDRKAWLVAPAGGGMKEHYKSYNKSIKLIAAPAFNRLIIGSRMSYETREHLPMLNNNLFDFEKVEAYDTYGNKLKIGPLQPT